MSPTPLQSELYHTGIVVHDLEAAMADLTEATGVSWGSPGQMVVPVWCGEERDVDFRAVYSAGGPPLLELVQHVEGTLWTCKGDAAIHHIGHWSDDVEATAKLLEGRGFECVAASKMGGDALVWTYHQRGSGPLIEHVSTELRPMILGDFAPPR